jgi:hypothetical protein
MDKVGAIMTPVENLELQVEQLTPPDFAKFREWFHAYEWQAWDRQIENDSKSGTLKGLAAKARADHAAGRTSRI